MEKAVLIGLITPNITLELVEEYLVELDFLARTAGAKTVNNSLKNFHIQITQHF